MSLLTTTFMRGMQMSFLIQDIQHFQVSSQLSQSWEACTTSLMLLIPHMHNSVQCCMYACDWEVC